MKISNWSLFDGCPTVEGLVMIIEFSSKNTMNASSKVSAFSVIKRRCLAIPIEGLCCIGWRRSRLRSSSADEEQLKGVVMVVEFPTKRGLTLGQGGNLFIHPKKMFGGTNSSAVLPWMIEIWMLEIWSLVWPADTEWLKK